MLSPEDQRLRLPLPQELLPLRVELDVRAIVVEQVQLHATCLWTFHAAEIHVPVIRADKLRTAMSMQIGGLDPVQRKEGQQRDFRVCPAILPQCMAHAVPDGCEAFFVGVGICSTSHSVNSGWRLKMRKPTGPP